MVIAILIATVDFLAIYIVPIFWCVALVLGRGERGGGLERAIGCLRPVVGWWSALVNWFCALVRAGESGW